MRGAYYFDLFAFTNNLIYRIKPQYLVGLIIPLFVQRSKYCHSSCITFFCWFRKIISKWPLRQRCWGEDFLPPKEFLMLYSELSGFRKEDASNVLICSVKNVPNHLDLKKIMNQMSWYVVWKMFQIIWFLEIWYINYLDMSCQKYQDCSNLWIATGICDEHAVLQNTHKVIWLL